MDDRVYTQEDDDAMGSPQSVTFAIIYGELIELKVFRDQPNLRP